MSFLKNTYLTVEALWPRKRIKMKLLFLLISLGVLSSCSSVQEKKNLLQRIQAEEVRSLQEIKSHAEFILEKHPELDGATKKELGFFLDTTITKQQGLKAEESKIFQILLSKSLRINQLNESELKDKNRLKIRLNEIYREKSRNVLVLINKIVSLSQQNAISHNFRRDMMDLIRDSR